MKLQYYCYIGRSHIDSCYSFAREAGEGEHRYFSMHYSVVVRSWPIIPVQFASKCRVCLGNAMVSRTVWGKLSP